MTRGKVEIVESAGAAAERAAEIFARAASDSIAERGEFIVSLAGGSTPKTAYRLISESGEIAELLPNIRFYFGDERLVPPDDEQSNFRMADEALFRPLEVPPGNIVRWQTETGDVESAALAYDAEIERFGSRFDLMILGLGTDCHTASLFPNTKALEKTARLAVANEVPQLGETRLTLTFNAINRSRRVLFLVTGSEKSAAVRSMLEGEIDIVNCPAQGVRPEDGTLKILLDAEAAAELRR